MKFKLLFVLLIIITRLNGQVMWQIKKDTVVKWYYYDGDEFDQSYPDTLKWYPAYSYSKMNYDFGFLMQSKRIVLENGLCKFMAYRDTGLFNVPEWQVPTFEKDYKKKMLPGDKIQYLFTLGTIWSRQEYNKGYFEIRFKTTDSYGMWPGFWMYGTNQKDEIDFFELKGEKKRSIHIDVHCPEGCDNNYRGGGLFSKRFGGWIKTTEDLNISYNVLSGEWQDGYVKWYLNGKGIGYFTGDFASQKMSLIAGMGLAIDGKAFAPGVNKTTVFPNSLDVDYIRVWYKNETSKENILGIKHKQFYYYNSEIGNSKPRKKKRQIKKVFKQDLLTVSLLPSIEKKFILTSLGENIKYQLVITELSGKELLKENINTTFKEINLAGLTTEVKVKVKLYLSYHTIEEVITIK
ncbi:MAG: family 16 glycosylhydrolase [Bacteroidetes bacterium]|nr:family 16 glycosylhydrolase [Bacteroidota bacterium]